MSFTDYMDPGWCLNDKWLFGPFPPNSAQIFILFYTDQPLLQRLDSAVMHVSCIQAGTLLARLGRPEVSNCIAALEQYGAAYEEIGEHAVEIKRIYASASSGDFDFNHMASVAPRSNGTVVDNDHAMNIDPTSANDNDSVNHHLFFRWIALTKPNSSDILPRMIPFLCRFMPDETP